MTPDWFYEFLPKDEVVIVNEYDQFIFSKPFLATHNGIQGLWSLANRKVLLFSATSHKGMERIVEEVLGKVVSLKFQSEFEILNRSGGATDGLVLTFRSEEELLSRMLDEAKKYQ